MDFEKQHQSNIARYQKLIREIYEAAIIEASQIGQGIPNFDPTKPFYFANYPLVQKKIQKVLDSLYDKINIVIVDGIDAEWTLANNKNSELSRTVFGNNLAKIPKPIERKYFSNNNEAKQQFLKRKTKGMGISDRIWNYTQQYKEELELGLDIGLRNGLSAQEMSRDLKSYLKQPDKLFRRVRDEHGNLRLSKNAKAYHPGQGVYRSSYKNSLRLTATETNMAYRKADYERRQNAHYIVGIEVKLSNNHTLNGVAFTDICDELKGKYPKDFVFTGWHPFCRCYTVDVLITEDEMDQYWDAIDKGETPKESINQVDGTPKQFNDWVKENKDRIEKSKSLPYFVKDNEKYFSKHYNLESIKKVFNDLKFNSINDAKLGSKEWLDSMTPDEKSAIFEYTNEKYRVINWKLRGIKDIASDSDNLMIQTIEKVLTNSPKTQMTSYRGMTISDDLFNDYLKLKKGDLYIDKGFMSTSAYETIANDFAKYDKNRVHLTIKGKNGTYINQLSDNKSEAEILFNKNSSFKIITIKAKKGNFVNELFINMEEI